MKLSKRTNAIILWTISIGLLVSMVIAFTPTLGNLFGNSAAETEGAAELVVNGQTIRELQVAQARQNPPYNVPLEGEAGEDLELLLAESLIDQTLLAQAASSTRVSNSEVNEAVREFRESQGLAGARNDQQYLARIGQFGFTDATFRDYIRQQLRTQKYQEALTEDVSVSDEEVEAYYQANQNAYQSEARIRARQIVLDDEAAAQAALERLQAGEDFAALASEVSQELADRSGALGAASGSSEPQPVTRAALPEQVAEAAFNLRGAGLVGPTEAGGRYYLVQVEEYIPSGVRPLEDVRDEVEADALAAKQAATLEATFDELRASAEIEAPETSSLSLEDPVVARVGETEVRRSELARSLYLNPQIQQSLTPETADIITSLFKPTILEQLIERELAYQGARELDATFFGSKGQIAQQALAYLSRDASASEEEQRAYYEANLESFTVPASAVVTRVDFEEQQAATDFRDALLAGDDLAEAAEAHGGQLEDLGTVQPGMLQEELDSVLFETDGFETLPSGQELSDVLVLEEPVEAEDEAEAPAEDAEDAPADQETGEEAADPAETEAETEDAELDAAEDGEPEDAVSAEEGGEGETAEEEAAETSRELFVVLVAQRTPERVRSFEEVRAQVEQAVLQTERSELQEAWLAELRERIEVENLLAEADAPLELEPGAGVTEELPVDPEVLEAPADDEVTDPAPTEPSEEETPGE